MSHANSALTVADLDFDSIRSSLKTFLSSQTKFVDYDFEGSNMSVLLDLLAYNTHYNTFYLNMVGNEMFLKSAQLRNNVVERSQELGYTPASARGASVDVDITIVPTGSPTSINMPKDTKFTTVVDDNTLTFTNQTAVVITADANSAYIAKATTIYEGFPLTHTYTHSTTTPVEFLIPNVNVDTNRLTVRVKESATATAITTYTKASDVTELTPTSTVYFLEETENNQYRVYFGDNILGKQLDDGNQVLLDYHITNTSEGNGANTFTSSAAIDGHSDVTVSLNVVGTSAAGGLVQENTESVKFNAPFHYEAQNRAVTKGDYERIILSENTDFSAVSVWGGEDHSTPTYGKVFIAVKPSVGTVISQTRKDLLFDSLDNRNVLSIDPEIVDASFLYVVPTIEVNYNPDKTTLTTGAIKSAVLATITAFETNNLNTFGQTFRYSKFVKAIDDTNSSILSNETTIKMQKQFIPTTGTSTKYTIEYRNPIQNSGNPGDITSTTFTFGGDSNTRFRSNAAGTIDIVTPSGSDFTVVSSGSGIGTVNYNTGVVTINSFNPSAVGNSGTIELNAIPTQKDIIPLRDQILNITDTTITITEDREV